jgi:peptide/nickel transport system substrate-binding protein
MSALVLACRLPGMLTTVQDGGRWGYQGKGMPVAGAMDLQSFRLGNILVGNDENYWGGAPKIKKITMRPISNAATRTAALLTGEVDIIEDVPVRDVAKVKSTEGIEVVDRPSERLIYLHVDSHRAKGPGIIDLDKNPLADIRVRKALSLAINRDSIVKMIMNGNAYATNQMVLKGRRGYVEDMPEAKYDPEEAKKLLTEAGYPDGFKVYLSAALSELPVFSGCRPGVLPPCQGPSVIG